jgi:hypothetical protein
MRATAMATATWVLGVVALAAVACGASDPAPPARDAAFTVPPDGAADLAAAPDARGAEAAAPGPDTAMCAPPIASCTTSAAGMCDHVCQTRCGCGQRCAFVGGVAACVPPAETPVALGGACSEKGDDCAAGTVCLNEASPACKSHCYRYCRTDADCSGGARCSFEVEVGGATVAKACSAPPETCDPTGEARCLDAGRPAPTFGCYVLSAQAPDLAACDCAGNRKLGQACMFEHECAPGLECIRVGSAEGACRQVCRLGAAGSCPGGAACAPLGTAAAPSTVFGYCAM